MTAGRARAATVTVGRARGAMPVLTGVVAAVLDSPLGPLSVYADAVGLCGLYLDGHRPAPPAGLAGAPIDAPRLAEVAAQLEQYFAGRRRRFELPLSLRGTDFQRSVWAELCRLPVGHTATYGELARRVGRPAAVRAVGAANGRNPISIIVPCHRVVGHDGALVGYAGGVQRKRFLLEHERALTAGDQPTADEHHVDDPRPGFEPTMTAGPEASRDGPRSPSA